MWGMKSVAATTYAFKFTRRLPFGVIVKIAATLSQTEATKAKVRVNYLLFQIQKSLVKSEIVE